MTTIAEIVDALTIVLASVAAAVQDLKDHPQAATVDPAALAPLAEKLDQIKVDLGDVAPQAAPASTEAETAP